jgi:membrane-associated protease RseP (regulator of RpoE activity)
MDEPQPPLLTEPQAPESQVSGPQAPEPQPLRWRLSLLLFLLTCWTTSLYGWSYSLGVMLILTAHEFGHYIQARRYGVPASLPYFIPMPNLFGTMGAVIAMRPQGANRRALFDVAITGPIAGLIPTLVLSYIGLTMSTLVTAEESENLLTLGEPLVFKAMSYLVFGPLPEGQDIMLHPLAYAGWVGLLITALNLMPIGQLDGGHILYALAPKHAFAVSWALFGFAIVATIVWSLWHWSLMLLLLGLMLRHPPAAEEGVPLDGKRRLLGCLMLLFVPVGFTPAPFVF